ncbi:MAG TPA: TetR/AcrR family transcriptional regulator [Bryobacteraceae bacterium]|nr:TetR/AcrR family transcriptional regulator [Bryobacteraceae bacterium]
MRDPERTKESVLEAAERLIAEKGIQALTLEEVAAGAGVSKGGLLHHYASKSALVSGLAQRMIVLHEQEIEEYRKKDPASPGSYTRAYLRANLNCVDECTQVCAAMTAESRNFPAMRELFKRYTLVCQERLENDGLDPVTASIVRYAVEGLMSSAIWDMPRPSNYSEIVQHLMRLAGAPASTKA